MGDTTPIKEPDRSFAKLEEDYKKTIPEKIKILQKHIDDLRLSIQKETLSDLRMEIHKIAGSAGTFGYPHVSDLCKEFERDLIQKINEFSTVKEKSAWIDSFDSFLKKIKKGFHTNL